MRVHAFAITIAALLLAGAATAATIDIHMKNKGTDGAMVFEPGFVVAQPGDTINFISDDKGHNVETIAGMLPDGAEALKSKASEAYSVTLTTEGLYGIKCTPHFGLGMVGLIQVGAATNYDAAVAVVQKGKAKTRLDADFALVTR
ncbi:MAG: pseudoazurin [Paracoccaceae bacterium]